MARPDLDPSVLVNGQEAWDAVLRDLLTGIVSQPFPVAEYADFASLPTASNYDRCLACTADDSKLYYSKSGVWREVSLV